LAGDLRRGLLRFDDFAAQMCICSICRERSVNRILADGFDGVRLEG